MTREFQQRCVDLAASFLNDKDPQNTEGNRNTMALNIQWAIFITYSEWVVAERRGKTIRNWLDKYEMRIK